VKLTVHDLHAGLFTVDEDVARISASALQTGNGLGSVGDDRNALTGRNRNAGGNHDDFVAAANVYQDRRGILTTDDRIRDTRGLSIHAAIDVYRNRIAPRQTIETATTTNN